MPAAGTEHVTPATGGTVVDHRAITTIRLLAADAVEAAGSGHPGLPMGCATAAYALWTRILRHDPSDPQWPDRDRFVLSAGHGSMLLYALLHLCGYALPLEELRRFRQWGSRTPGHPEYGNTPGVETTTGPLGQGFANAVGMALAERMLASRYNCSDAPDVVDHRTFVLASDGDMMEGINHEAAALAGHLGLGRLIVLYDDNRVSIDGPTALAMSEDVGRRYSAYGWDVHHLDESAANDVDAVVEALVGAVAETRRPSLILLRTRIGYGAPTKEGLAAAHGAPLGSDELRATKSRFGWDADAAFVVPADVREHMAAFAQRGRAARDTWEAGMSEWTTRHPSLAQQWMRTQRVRPPADLLGFTLEADPGARIATRVASGRALEALGELTPELVGGSADLADSTNATLQGGDVRRGHFDGRMLRFGVREHAMGAILNGMALHRGLRVFGSTFLVFSDYMRPAIRLAALMGLPVIFVFTHDSIAVGEDGPTHQPVEQLLSLRAIPGLAVLRPADVHETAWAWSTALRRTEGPTALVLSRQGLPVLPRGGLDSLDARGARVVREARDNPDVVLVASGSEVETAVSAAEQLDVLGIDARVVSMPWREQFLRSPAADRASLIPAATLCVSVEAAHPLGWEQVTGAGERVIGVDRYGASAPGPRVLQEYGITAEAVLRRVVELTAEASPSHR